MMTNHEWGAVAYLSASLYGADDVIWQNSCNGNISGCSGSTYNSSDEDICIHYYTNDGQKASTTHNIYGVYDMSGGAWERVMANYNALVGNSGFISSEFIKSIEKKYLTRYETSPEELLDHVGMNYDFSVYGDAVYETSFDAIRYNGSIWIGRGNNSWHRDCSYLPHTGYPWFSRGGNWNFTGGPGIFDFDHSGYTNARSTFRPVLTPLS